MLKKITLFTAMFVLGISSLAFAFTAPAAGSLWYDFYDTFFNGLMTGSLGFVATGCLLLFCLYNFVKGNLLGGGIAACAAACMIGLEDIVISMGFWA